MRVVDVGSGIGGSARHLAAAHDCDVSGIDATKEYCNVATMLSDRVGLAHRTTFTHGSALDLPYPHASFDLAWTEHVQMNIDDKETFYAEIARVLKPGGRFVFHDVFQGPAGPVRYPVPWANRASISHLIAPGDVSELLGALGFAPIEWRNVTTEARDWFAERATKKERPRTSIQLLMGDNALDKFANMRRNLDENRVAVIQAVLTKTG
jgi:SAM-dependent methyltransferase